MLIFTRSSLISGDTQRQELTEPVALKIVPGTQLIAKTNLQTGAVELNVPLFTQGEES